MGKDKKHRKIRREDWIRIISLLMVILMILPIVFNIFGIIA